MHSEEALLEDVARLESKLKAFRRKGNLAVESQICNLLGKKYELLGEWKEALTFHYFDSEIGAAMDDYEGQLIALNNTALLYRRLNLTAKAKEIYNRMLYIAGKAPTFAQKKCLSGVVDACVGLGSIGLEKSEKHPKIIRDELTRKAFGSMERASNAAKKYQSLIDDGLIGQTDTNKQDALEMGIRALYGMGLFYAHSETPKDALSFYDRALTKATQMEAFDEGLGRLWAFRALEAKGRALGRAREWPKAIESCFDAQLTLAKEHLQDDQVAEAQYNLAEACFFLGDYGLAKSTALTCIDTIKVRGTDQTKSAKAEALMCKIFEAMEQSSNLESLEAKISKESDEPSLVDYLFQASQLLKKLERYNEAYLAAKRTPPFLERGTYGRVTKKKVYQLVTSLAVQQKAWSDAMFYGRKWLETLEDHEDEALINCLLKLVSAHVESSSVNRSILGYIERCHDLVLSKNSDKELECLSSLSLVHDSLGNPEDASRFRDECFGLALAIQNEAEDLLGKDYHEIEATSYFGDRKVSRTTKSLMGGDFQMTTRTNKAGLIAKRRVKALSITAPVNKATTKRIKPTKVIHENLESASDLEDFIASSSDPEKENLDRRKKGKHQKDRASVFLSSDSEIEDAFATVSISASQKERLDIGDGPNYVDPSWAEAMNDFGPIGWDEGPAHVEAAPYKQLALRIRIQVAHHVLVVPCFDDDITERKKVSWLIKEASKRYAELDEKEPIIKALSYLNSDAFLSPNDPVALVLTDGQTVKAHIDGWRQRSWLQEYQYQMQRLDIPSVDFLEQTFAETSSDSAKFDFSYTEFNGTCTELLVSTLKAKCESFAAGFELDLTGATGLCYANLDIKLSGLNVSFIALSDLEETELISLVVANMEHLIVLNVSFIQASDGFISHLLTSLCKFGPTSSLKSLDLSGYMFPDDTNFDALHFLSSLEVLWLEACVLNSFQLEGLAKFIPKSHTIQKLALHLVNEEEARLLSAAISQNFSVNSLDLLDTRSEIISIFSSSLVMSPSLKELECNMQNEECRTSLLSRGVIIKTHNQL